MSPIKLQASNATNATTVCINSLQVECPLQVTMCAFFSNPKPQPPFCIIPLEHKFQLITVIHNVTKQKTNTTMKVCCGIIITYNLQLVSNDFGDESLKAKKACGDERKKKKCLFWQMEQIDG